MSIIFCDDNKVYILELEKFLQNRLHNHTQYFFKKNI